MYKTGYVANGEQTEYFFGAECKWFQSADIRVAVDGDELQAEQYAVRQLPDEPEYETEEQAAANDTGRTACFGGKVILAAPPAAGAKIEIRRELSPDRTICYQQMERILPEHLNADFDYMREYVAELKERLDGIADLASLPDISEQLADARDLLASVDNLATVQQLQAVAVALAEQLENLEIPDLEGYAKLSDISGMPDYASGVAKTWDTEITAAADCWVYICSVNTLNAMCQLTVDGEPVFYDLNSGTGSPRTSGLIPVPAGGVYKASGNTGTLIEYSCKEI
jgi:hypothetical protein